MRIILFGIPDFGIICLDALMAAKKNVVAVVLPPENHPTVNNMHMAAAQHAIPSIKVGTKMKDPQLIEEIKSYNPDIIIIAAYAKLIPKEIYEIPPLGMINCHPSLLPQYRGSNPYFYVIYYGEKETGITFHYLDSSFDTGDIIEQYRVPLASNETLGTLFYRLSVKSSQLYVELLNKIERGEQLPRIPQPKTLEGIKNAPEIKFTNPILRINWADSAMNIERLIRAANPFYGVYGFYKNSLFKIWSAHFENKPYKSLSAEPGTIIKVSRDSMAINTGQGLLYPTALEYGLLYNCDIREFIARNNPRQGECLI